MKYSINDFEEFKKERFVNYIAQDETLYDLCRKYPDHSSMNAINAKLCIIGRSYATGIERAITNKKKTQSGSLGVLAKKLHNNKKTVNRIVASLPNEKEPLGIKSIRSILVAHNRFLDIVTEVTRSNYTPRSFVSKYLHFHCPSVPIYDSVVVKEINNHVRWNDALTKNITKHKNADDEYYWYVVRFWKLYKEVSEKYSDATVKDVDRLLLQLAYERKVAK